MQLLLIVLKKVLMATKQAVSFTIAQEKKPITVRVSFSEPCWRLASHDNEIDMLFGDDNALAEFLLKTNGVESLRQSAVATLTSYKDANLGPNAQKMFEMIYTLAMEVPLLIREGVVVSFYPDHARLYLRGRKEHKKVRPKDFWEVLARLNISSEELLERIDDFLTSWIRHLVDDMKAKAV